METKDTTGAGKTLDKLMNWWQGTFRSGEEAERDAYAEAVGRHFQRESALLARMKRNLSGIRYEFLRRELGMVMDIQTRIVEQLRRLAAELGKNVSDTTVEAETDTFGLTFSKDLHEAREMYNEYARLAAKSAFTELQERFEDLTLEKDHLIRILAELAPKIHN